MAGFELLEHTADLGIRAHGDTLATAFNTAVRGLSTILVGADAARPRDSRPVALEDQDLEALLVALLEECLYLLDAQAWVAADARLSVSPEGVLHGELAGEPFDPDRHGDGLAVKAITWHQLAVEQRSGYVEVTVFVDC